MAIDLKNNKYVLDFKQGLLDIKSVLQEGNAKLFVKPFIAVLVVFLGYYYMNGKFMEKRNIFEGQMAAIHMEQSNEQEYMANKMKLISLEPKFPDIANKNEWLLSQLLGIYREADIATNLEGSQTEDTSNPSYVVASMQIGSTMNFPQFASFLAGIENRSDYIKVSGFTLTKDTDPERVASNQISIRYNTVFPKEKVAPALFKDYATLVAGQTEQAAATAKKRN